MTLCTAYLLRDPVTAKLGLKHTRYQQSLTCGSCTQTYTLEYEAACTDPNDIDFVVASAQRVIDEYEHFPGHQKAVVEIANNTIRRKAG